MRAARRILAHSARVLPASRREWSDALLAELEYLPPGAGALRWALGCLLACYAERYRLMRPATAPISRWILSLEMLTAFVPLTWLFAALAVRLPGPGLAPALMRWWLLYFSIALLGPLGLVLAARVVLLGRPVMGRPALIVLGVLAAWTAVACTGQLLHEAQGSLLGSWRDLALFVLLPALAAAHLIAIDVRARRRLAHP